MSDPTRTARRTVLAAGAAALAGGALTACGEATEPTPESSGSPATGGAAVPKGLVKASEVPVGGGTVLKAEKIVVTQPEAGTFKAFSAVCTHQGCLVNKVQDGSIVCPCHDSEFDASDGAVTKGPATKPLPERKVQVTGGEITLA
ncbi:Rieske (2Fe-2S) protein [Streptomyces sp. NPDC012888]|uniref:Rieske (2Fe-2S) protein n=1 Tax=Streptomyces sp. NPDC012888 TaxID=3364855 RepID=UPI00367E2507